MSYFSFNVLIYLLIFQISQIVSRVFKFDDQTFYQEEEITIQQSLFSSEETICQVQIQISNQQYKNLISFCNIYSENVNIQKINLEDTKAELDFIRTEKSQDIKIRGNTYYEIIYQQCLPCGQYCNGCTNYYQCNDCIKKDISGRYDYLYDKTCGTCNDGLSSSTFSNQCKGKSDKCKDISSDGRTCNSCKDSSLYINEELATCQACDINNGWYVTDKYCRRCPYQCLSCKGPNSNDCITCRSRLLKYDDGTCQFNSNNLCLDGYYKSSLNCIKCPSKCTKCESENSCSECEGGSFIMQNKLCGGCLIGKGEFIDGKQCSKCTEFCQSCQNEKTCQVCQNNYYLKEDNSGCMSCLQNSSFFIDGNYCRTCDTSCLTCSETKTKCLSCNGGLFLTNDNKCVKCDQDGFYIENQKCLPCNSLLSCQKCLNNTSCSACNSGKYIQSDINNQCDICKDGFFTSGIYCKRCKDNCNKCKDLNNCEQCAGGFYSKSGICTQCPNDLKCLTCQDENTCTSCKSGEYIQPNNACDICKEGYYIDGTFCKNCKQNCQKCSSQDTCTQCIDGYFLKSGSCEACSTLLNCLTCSDKLSCTSCFKDKYIYLDGKCDVCLQGYIIEDKFCKKCPEYCEKCSSVSQCTQCSQGYFLKGNICQQCTPQMNCLTCLNESSCQSCEPGKFIKDDKRCDKCEDGFFVDNINCKKCKDNCAKCKSYDICDNCQANYYFEDNTTSPKCIQCSGPGKFIFNGTTCKNCRDGFNCLTCNENLCLTCDTNSQNKYLYVKEGKCGDCKQDDGFYINEDQKCFQCNQSINCKTCSSDSKCLTCQQDYYLNSLEQCVRCDQEGQYIDGSSCKSCNSLYPNCKQCTKDGCKICQTNYYLYPNKTCSLNCGDTYYISYQDCKPCENNCKTCENQFQCKTCKDSYLLQADKTCKQACSEGFYTTPDKKCLQCNSSLNCKTCSNDSSCNDCQDSFFKNKNNICVPCTESGFYKKEMLCLECKQELNCQSCEEDKCLSCKLPNQYIQENGSCSMCQDQNGYFIEDKYCKKCNTLAKCKTCKNKTECLACYPPDNLQQDKTCGQCQEGQYSDQSLCKPCNPELKCKTCENGNSCQSCYENFFLDFQKKCQDCKGDGIFIEKATNQCMKCNVLKNCKTCENTNDCISCQNGSYLYDDNSCKPCGDGFFIEGDRCKKCNQTSLFCATCSKIDSCNSCLDGYFLDSNSVCVKCDQNGQYKEGNKCKNCDQQLNCLTCLNRNSCETCKGDDKIQEDFRCAPCVKGYFAEGKICKKCKEELKCQACSNFKECDSCFPGDFLKPDKSCGQCQDGFFQNQISKNCDPCYKNCKTCKAGGEKDCLLCLNANEYLFTEGNCGICREEDGYIQKDKFCIQCAQNCQKCSGASLSECISCKSGFNFMTDGRCDKCDYNQGKFIDQLTKNCRDCHITCKTCRGERDDQCDECKIGYIKDNQEKCNICKVNDGQFIDLEGKCQVCHQNCQTCNGKEENKCLTCRSGFYKDEKDVGKCISCDTENGFFISGEFCKKCHSTCKKCLNSSSEKSCIECSGEKLLYSDNSCQECNTQSGFYIETNANIGLRKCLSCHTDCLTCKDSNQNKCIKCKEEHAFFDQNNICRKCHHDCKECFGAEQNQCITCLTPKKYLSSDKNICSTCKQNEFNDGVKCLACSPNCNKCQSYDVCLDCGNDTQIKKDKFCGSCDENEYSNDKNICSPCHSDCYSCYGPNKTDCKKCQDKRLIINKQGICGSCDSNQYSDNYRCQDCHRDCKQCSGGKNTECKECNDSSKYFCKKENITNFKTNHGNEQECYKSCLKCHENCQTCFGEGKNQCMTCAIGILQKDFSCSKDCNEGEYFDETTKSCEECHSSCKQCFGKGNNQCTECSDDKAFLDQFNTCVYDCGEGYKKNIKTKKCQQCLYQKNPDNTMVCVLECLDNQFIDSSTRYCTNCENNCSKCTSLTFCTECVQGMHFSSKNQESCRVCETNEYVTDYNVCEVCPFLNCLQCNQRQCTKCMYKYLVNDKTGLCIYDTRYNSYECEGVSRDDESCQQEIDFINKSDLFMKTTQYTSLGLQVVGSFYIGLGSFAQGSILVQQVIGNNMFQAEALKTLSLGPTYYDQNYQMNILSLIPNPLSSIHSYDKFINKRQESNMSFRTNSQLNDQEINQANKQSPNRLLENYLVNNDLSFIQSRDSSGGFIDSFLKYLFIMSFVGIVILVFNMMNPNNNKMIQYFHNNKYCIFIQLQMLFSNYMYVQIFKSITSIDFYNLQDVDYISIGLQLIRYNPNKGNFEDVKDCIVLVQNLMINEHFNKYYWYFFEMRKCICLLVPDNKLQNMRMVDFTNSNGNQCSNSKFIISTDSKSDIDYKWRQINQNNIKAKKFLKLKTIYNNQFYYKSSNDNTIILNNSSLNSNLNSFSNEQPVDVNDLSIKWSMNPMHARHIAMQEFSRKDLEKKKIENPFKDMYSTENDTADIKKIIQSYLNQHIISKVQINMNKYDDDLHRLDQLFLELKNFTHLSHLVIDFSLSQIDLKSFQLALSHLSSIKNIKFLCFSLSEIGAGENECMHLSQSVQQFKSLIQLDIDIKENQIKDKGLTILFQGIQKLENLQSLKFDIGNGNISDQGISSIGSLVKDMNMLQDFNLIIWENEFSCKGLAYFANSLISCQRLKYLNLYLAENFNLENLGFCEFLKQIGQIKGLKHFVLNLVYCKLSMSYLIDSFLSNLKKLKSLNTLEVYNQYQSKADELLTGQLMKLNRLVKLIK
ncbi:hypothetical protein ABPG72_019907 [Tetrahymena utriculariae]